MSGLRSSRGRPRSRPCACGCARASAAGRSRAPRRRCAGARNPARAAPRTGRPARPCGRPRAGARIITRVPSGSASTWSTICETLCAASARPVLGAVGVADAREEQAQVVVDLGHRADGGARVVRGRLLLDRDRGRQPLDQVDVRLLHELQELAGVRGEGFHVAPLALGIERVEGEGGLSRAGKAGDHHQPVARDVEVTFLRLCVRAPRMRMWSMPRRGSRVVSCVLARPAPAATREGNLLIYLSVLSRSNPHPWPHLRPA